jgi:hypothetical protein
MGRDSGHQSEQRSRHHLALLAMQKAHAEGLPHHQRRVCAWLVASAEKSAYVAASTVWLG